MKRHAPLFAVLGSLIVCACAAPSAAVGEFDESSSATGTPSGADEPSSNGGDGADDGGDPKQCEGASGTPNWFGVFFMGDAGLELNARKTFECAYAGTWAEMDCLDEAGTSVPLQLQFNEIGLAVGELVTVDINFRSALDDGNIAVAVRDTSGALRFAGSIGEDFTVDPPWEPELTITPVATDCPTVEDEQVQELIRRQAIRIQAAELPPGTLATVFEGQRVGFSVDGSADYEVHVAEARRFVEHPSVSNWYDFGIVVTPP